MQLSIRTLTGKAITIEVEQTDTILSVKEKVQDKEGIPPEQQRLSYVGSILADEKTLADIKFVREPLLHLVLRSRCG
eukprot:TRINITY_DN136346_c0_g1_i1.p1 TRINITY_DN136346_c0_g1~~TRINITY_DN136346_c0_g1_i1.p1  ORF type:complete len:77 (+),score=13.21 TRINITY_DN136346_c0_g1_i1:1-231(+)